MLGRGRHAARQSVVLCQYGLNECCVVIERALLRWVLYCLRSVSHFTRLKGQTLNNNRTEAVSQDRHQNRVRLSLVLPNVLQRAGINKVPGGDWIACLTL